MYALLTQNVPFLPDIFCHSIQHQHPLIQKYDKLKKQTKTHKFDFTVKYNKQINRL